VAIIVKLQYLQPLSQAAFAPVLFSDLHKIIKMLRAKQGISRAGCSLDEVAPRANEQI
jgi:hypothetical protein